MFTFVEAGSVNADNAFVSTSVTGTAILYKYSNIYSVLRAIRLQQEMSAKSGNTLSVNVDDKTIELRPDTARIKGITATANGDLLFGANGSNEVIQISNRNLRFNKQRRSVTLLEHFNSNLVNTLDGGTFVSQIIKIKRSETLVQSQALGLATHEIAMNVSDKKIFTKKADGTIVTVASHTKDL